ncbi:MAG: hypothetical protein EAS48_00530 [Chryseobacterium sp.]|nr:MAG: hypothetical protein EAS48_00530 [Chryseobacterium sp.]
MRTVKSAQKFKSLATFYERVEEMRYSVTLQESDVAKLGTNSSDICRIARTAPVKPQEEKKL